MFACYVNLFLSRVNKSLSWLEGRPLVRNGLLASINFFLVLLLLFQFNLVGFFPTGYDAAPLLLDIEQKDVQSITIEDPDFQQGRKVRLLRERVLSQNEWYVSRHGIEGKRESSFWDSLYSSTPIQYNWKLEVIPPLSSDIPSDLSSNLSSNASSHQDEKQQNKGREKKASPKSEKLALSSPIYSYMADKQRIVELFNTFVKMRRYYSVPRTAEKEKTLSMQNNDKGIYAGTKITFDLGNKKTLSLYLGKSSKQGNEAYVRREEEKEIYLVRADLYEKSGSGELEYFRNRDLFPKKLLSNQIRSVLAKRDDSHIIAHFVYNNGKGWALQYPISRTEVRLDSMNSFLQDVLDWRATDFPQDVPKGLDRKFSLTLEIRYIEGNQERQSQMIVLGREGPNDYILIMPDKSLRKVSSVYLEDILDPIKNFTKVKKSK